MKRLIILVAFALTSQLTNGQNPPDPVAMVHCKDNHTVDIAISNVDDADEWASNEWRLANNAACDPAIDANANTVTYTGLHLPDCAWESEQLADHIKYILKISAVKPSGGATGQLRAYDHLYYVSCYYDNQNKTSASFVPIKNRQDNDTDYAFFTFTLEAFADNSHNTAVPNPIALDQTLYFLASVVTQSGVPNLDLFPVNCWSSKSVDPDSTDGRFTLISEGCGNSAISQDLGGTLMYTCAANSTREQFSLKSYRYFGAAEGDAVYIHCDLRVCLADNNNNSVSRCECPDSVLCGNDALRRRSIADSIDESQVYHVSSGPFGFEEEEKEMVKEEVGSEEEDETNQSFQTVAIVGAVGGVVAVAIICATVYFVMRSRNKRRQNGDLNVVT